MISQSPSPAQRSSVEVTTQAAQDGHRSQFAQATEARLVRKMRAGRVLAGLALTLLGFGIVVALARFGFPLAEGSSGLAGALVVAGLLVLGLASQAALIGGAAIACLSFEQRCSSCGAPTREHSLSFPAEQFESLEEAVQSTGPFKLLDLVTTRAAAQGPEAASVELTICAGCGQAGEVVIARNRWCADRQRPVCVENGTPIAKAGWVLQQLRREAELLER